MDETPFFFRNGSLFGVYHAPAAAVSGAPFLFCHPFGEEKLWAHRAFVSFARTLAARGRAVLRFDYRGNGDSDGAFRDFTLDTALEDIGVAIEELKMRTRASTVALLGLRLGASLAARTADGRRDVDSLALWSPIIAGAPYLQELLRINLTTQMTSYREIREDREELSRQLAAGQAVNVDGYPVSAPLAAQLDALNMLGPSSPFGGPCLLAQVERNPNAPPSKDMQSLRGRYAAGELVVVGEDPFWKEIAKFYERAPNLFAATMRWLGQGEPAETA